MAPRLLAALAALLLSLAASARASEAKSADAKPAPPQAKVEQVAWMAGYWEGQGLGGTIEDLWGPPRAGVMLGAFRLTRADGKPGFYQLFAIEEWEGSLRFVFRHFHPSFIGWEEKEQANRLPLTRISAGEAAFGGVVFRRAGPDLLEVDLTMRGKDGTTRVEKLAFRKRPL